LTDGLIPPGGLTLARPGGRRDGDFAGRFQPGSFPKIQQLLAEVGDGRKKSTLEECHCSLISVVTHG